MSDKEPDLFAEIAEKSGVSKEKVIDDIQTMIDDLYGSPDPAVAAEWHKIMPDGSKPSPLMLLMYLAAHAEIKEH